MEEQEGSRDQRTRCSPGPCRLPYPGARNSECQLIQPISKLEVKFVRPICRGGYFFLIGRQDSQAHAFSGGTRGPAARTGFWQVANLQSTNYNTYWVFRQRSRLQEVHGTWEFLDGAVLRLTCRLSFKGLIRDGAQLLEESICSGCGFQACA